MSWAFWVGVDDFNLMQGPHGSAITLFFYNGIEITSPKKAAVLGHSKGQQRNDLAFSHGISLLSTGSRVGMGVYISILPCE